MQIAPEKIELLVRQIAESQNSANLQSVLTREKFEQALIPELKKLSESIKKSSDTSHDLTVSIRNATIAGVIVAGLAVIVAATDVYQTHFSSKEVQSTTVESD
ncbi:hypothetical protein AAY72_12085 [Alishewanella sp. WH16-1]|uniref:hypothetical protein n=1 Tax=Alishewanella sp. WH16-1 TaxID=1651088 RepID=UPI0007096994|nr:hypothetical protein [Alishewanella sp. WH16-1]KRS20884.1 hypothetical protein AAY72_12085 [Alishewanella sp. WH16-1]